ncbi:hypothetical protein V6N11_024855 [Hibiscus sabdariffa]|uniref:Uncharacterized protein n=1 Tax=Hibiscus sabdariffa TaxID=183260 RepID=A0ABR2QNB3_9ROSI
MPSESNADDFSTRVTSPALSDPIDYTLVWKSNDGSEGTLKGCSFFWLLQPPEVYKPINVSIIEFGAQGYLNEGCRGEACLPSSVSWFFENGALMFRKGDLAGEPIDANGSNLPGVGCNDVEFRIDLPSDGRMKTIKLGNWQVPNLMYM